MKNNETKCKDVLRWQCVLVATLYHLKRFLKTKRIKLYIWFRLKRFRGTKCGAHQILAVYDVRFGKGEK